MRTIYEARYAAETAKMKARVLKAEKLADYLRAAGITADDAEKNMDDEAWALAALASGTHRPSSATQVLVVSRLRAAEEMARSEADPFAGIPQL